MTCKISILLLLLPTTLSQRTRARASTIESEPLGNRSSERQAMSKRWRRYNIRRVPPNKQNVRKVRCERMLSRDRCAQCQKHTVRLASNSNNVLASKKCSSQVECEDAFKRCFVRKRRIFKKVCEVHGYEGVTAIKGTIEKNCRLPDLEELLLTNEMSAIETTDSLCLANGPTQKILETGKSDSYFGSSVAVSNNTIVIGTIKGKTNAGAAYVYTKDGDDWEQRAKLIASDVMKDDRFGWSVAINSAGDTVVVGAYFEESSKPGAAYIFKRAGSYWNQVAKLAGDKSSGDEFGAAVAIDDDTIVVGASEDESNNRGGAYVFTFNGSKWNRSAKITAPSTAVAFGAAVDIQGSRIVVSDPYNDKKTSDAGAVHVYSRSGSEWTKEVALSASDAQEYDYFGARASVALDGDTIAVGASGDDNTKGDDAGSVYIFDRLSSGSWKQTSKLTASDGTDYNYFGWSVALQNNVLVVGSFQAEKVYIYARSGSTWELKNTLINPNGSGEFGAAVALDGTAVIAGDASANDGAGRVTIYELC